MNPQAVRDTTGLRDEIRAVLQSGALHQSAVLRRVLEYLGEAAEQGRDDLKEYTIGLEALGKPASYDPQRDSTVRVQVGKLRQKLEEYYRDHGAGHAVRLSIPKGAFRLQLESNSNSRSHISKPLILVFAGLLIGVVTFGLGLRQAVNSSAPPRAGWTPDLRLLWQPIVGNGVPIVISFDTAMTIEVPPWRIRNSEINDARDLAASTGWRELSKKLGDPEFRTEYQYVGFGIVHGSFLLSQLLSGQRPRPVLKRSSILSWEDIANNHLIYMGTGKTAAKIRQILQRGDFRVDGNRVTNLKPQAGEPKEFPATVDARTREYTEQYGLISMLPGFDENTRVLVLGGGTAEGDWAIVEYSTSAVHVSDLVRHLKTASGELPRAFQVVVRIKCDSRVPISMNYVTHHVLSLPGGLQRETK